MLRKLPNGKRSFLSPLAITLVPAANARSSTISPNGPATVAWTPSTGKNETGR